jgi:hypothetical protein
MESELATSGNSSLQQTNKNKDTVSQQKNVNILYEVKVNPNALHPSTGAYNTTQMQSPI